EPHLAYDCSALALGSLNPSKLAMADQKTTDFPKFGKSVVFTLLLWINAYACETFWHLID
ncbi:MAG: hypothetical protein ABF858_10390, partial [Lacticaseibacillus paracasei]